MAGDDDRVRHCGTCRKNVYDLASLTRDEAEALFEQHEGSACVRYFRRHDGTVILRDCTDGMQIRMPPEMIAFWVLLILVGSVSLIMVAWGCANQSRGFGGASLVPRRELRG
ncbi:MAG TPA: hypothetical protein VL326_08800 [Kofleriaceae bacterium]|nr:hypothetical protein [Kofleriaceae bacterium]